MKLILKDLGFGYKGQVLSDFINLELNDCDYIVILGENGSGKSSLIKTILGLNKKISGEIIMEGISKDEIAYLPQILSIAADFPTSIMELVLSGFKIKKRFFYTKEEKRKAHDSQRAVKYANKVIKLDGRRVIYEEGGKMNGINK